jgi:hypothetical protein
VPVIFFAIAGSLGLLMSYLRWRKENAKAA